MATDVPDPILVAYDGSELSRRAIRSAAAVLRCHEAIVLHVHEPVMGVVPTVIGAPGVPSGPTVEQAAMAEEKAAERAREIALYGAREVESLGLSATSETAIASGSAGIADAIVAAAERRDACLIVLGSHGHSALRAALLGSVSTAVLHRATVPVLVVPARPPDG